LYWIKSKPDKALWALILLPCHVLYQLATMKVNKLDSLFDIFIVLSVSISCLFPNNMFMLLYILYNGYRPRL